MKRKGTYLGGSTIIGTRTPDWFVGSDQTARLDGLPVPPKRSLVPDAQVFNEAELYEHVGRKVGKKRRWRRTSRRQEI
jgi:hypothetical protein